ncbi:WapI family immunity protein [Deinococcus alpinitundrae]|uniref:WapI family immunity protein n=1 Tax=Deinococcus alpinitundrae TaxID=468913 RepID=UPI003F66ED36
MILREGEVVVELSVEDYQFPHIQDEEWDADWVFIRLQLQVGEHQWERTDPALTTFELENLAAWLQEVAQHADVFGSWKHNRLSTACFFTEPNLTFKAYSGHVSGQPVTLRLFLTHEFLPSFKQHLPNHSLNEDIQEVYLEFGVDEAQLRILSDQIRQDLRRFPVRGVQSSALH